MREDKTNMNDMPLPRVQEEIFKSRELNIPNMHIIPCNNDEIHISELQNFSNLPKNLRYRNEGTYKYNL